MLNRRNFILSTLAAFVAGLWPWKAKAETVRLFPVRDLQLTGPDHFGGYAWTGTLPVQDPGDTVTVHAGDYERAKEIAEYMLIEASNLRYVDGRWNATLGVVWREGTPAEVKARYPWACRA